MSKRPYEPNHTSPNVIVIVPTSLCEEGSTYPSKKPKIGKLMTPPLPPLIKKIDLKNISVPPSQLSSGNIAVPTQTVLPKTEFDDSIKTSQKPSETIAALRRHSDPEMFKPSSSSACEIEDAEKKKCVVDNIKASSKSWATASPKSWAAKYLESLRQVYKKPIKLNLSKSRMIHKMPVAKEHTNIISREPNEESTKNSNKSSMAISPPIQNNSEGISNITVQKVGNLKNEEDKNIKDSMECKKIVATETKLEQSKSSPTLLNANPAVVKKDTWLNHENKSFTQPQSIVPYERKYTECMPTTNFPNANNENIAFINTELAHHGSHGYSYSFYNNYSEPNLSNNNKATSLKNEGGNIFPRCDYSGSIESVKDKKYLNEIEAFLERLSKDNSVKNERKREEYKKTYLKHPDSYEKSYSKAKRNDYRVTPNNKFEINASQTRTNYEQSKSSYSSSKSYSSEKIVNKHETQDENKCKENDGCSEEKQKYKKDDNKTKLKRKNRASSSSSSSSSTSSSNSSRSTSTCSSQRSTKEKNIKKSPYRKIYKKATSPYRKSYNRSEQKVQKNTYSKITKQTEIYTKTKVNDQCNSLKSQYSEGKARHNKNEKKRRISREDRARSRSKSSTRRNDANKYKTVRKTRERSHSSSKNEGYRDRSRSSYRIEENCNKCNAKASDRNRNNDKTIKNKFKTERESRERSRGSSYNKGNTDRSPHSSHRIAEHCNISTLMGTNRNTDDDKTTKSFKLKSVKTEEKDYKILKKKIKTLKKLYESTKVSKDAAKKTSKVKEPSKANTSLERYTQNKSDGESELSNPIKSVVEVINNCVQDKFDLRTVLSRKNDTLQKEIERENLVVTVANDQEDVPEENLTKSKDINHQNAAKARAKKFKKIQLVINVICEKSESSNSDDDAENKIHGKCHSSNKEPSEDLSFLDDLNVEEIVKSLNGSSNSEVLGINSNNNIDHIIISDDESDASTVHLEDLDDSDVIQITDEDEVKREVENCKNVDDQGTRVKLYTKYFANNSHKLTYETSTKNMPGAMVSSHELKQKHLVQYTPLPSMDATTNLVNSNENADFNRKFILNNMEKDKYDDMKIPKPMICIDESAKEPLDNITESSTATTLLEISSKDPVIHKNKDKYIDSNIKIPKPMICIDEIKEEALDNITESSTNTNLLEISSRDPVIHKIDKYKDSNIKIPKPMICIDEIKEEPLDNITENSTNTNSLEISSRDPVIHKIKDQNKDSNIKIPKPMICIDEIKEEPLDNITESSTNTNSLEVSSRDPVIHKIKDQYKDSSIKIPKPMICIDEIKEEPLHNITESTDTNSLEISSRDPVVHKNKNVKIPKPMISIDQIEEEPLDNITESTTGSTSLEISSRDPVLHKNRDKYRDSNMKIPKPMICIDEIKEEPLDNIIESTDTNSLEIISRDPVVHKNKNVKIPEPMISIDQIKEEPLDNITESSTGTTSLEISSRGPVLHKKVSNLKITKMTDDQNITFKNKLLIADLKLKPGTNEINTVPSGYLNKVLEKETNSNLDSIKINTDVMETRSNPLVTRNNTNALRYNCATVTELEAKIKNDKVITGPNTTGRLTVLSENSGKIMENDSRDVAPDSNDTKTEPMETDNSSTTIYNNSTMLNANGTIATEKETEATIDMERSGSNILYQEINSVGNSEVKGDKFNTLLQKVTENTPHAIMNTKMTDAYNYNKNKLGNLQNTTENLIEKCDDTKQCEKVTTNVEGKPTSLETQENIAMLKEVQDSITIDSKFSEAQNNTRRAENVNISDLKEKNIISLNSPLNTSVTQNVSDLSIPDAKDNLMTKKNIEILEKTKAEEQPTKIEKPQLHDTKTKCIADKKNKDDFKSIKANQLHVKTDTKEEDIKKSVNPKSNTNNSPIYVKSTALKIKTPNPLAKKISAPSPSGTEITGSNTHKCTLEIRPAEKHLVLDLKCSLLKSFNVPYDSITLIHRGKFSKIFSCKNSHGQTYTAKIVRRKYHCDDNVIDNILKPLQSEIPKENLFFVHHIDSFSMKGLWCLLMDFYPKNLSQALKETDKVFHINLIQQLSKQLVSAVTVLRNNNIIHTDIKPSHILMNSSNDHLKLCGFDQAMNSINELNPTITTGTVNYRAPELILGYPAGFGIDVWSTALVMFEMATKRKLFPGIYDNDILFKQMCTLEYMPFDMITQSRFGGRHFKGTLFKRRTGDKGQIVKLKNNQEIFRNNILRSSINFAYWNSWGMNATKKNRKRDLAKLSTFTDLLEQMLTMHPNNRMPIEYVYAYPFMLQIPE